MIAPTQEQKELAEERLAICDACPAKNSSLNVCSECHCWIPAKVFTKDPDSCPYKKANNGGWVR
jgi:hypothetical protein